MVATNGVALVKPVTGHPVVVQCDGSWFVSSLLIAESDRPTDRSENLSTKPTIEEVCHLASIKVGLFS